MPEQLQLPGIPRARVHLIEHPAVTEWVSITVSKPPVEGWWDVRFKGNPTIERWMYFPETETFCGEQEVDWLPPGEQLAFWFNNQMPEFKNLEWRGLAQTPELVPDPVPTRRRVLLNPS